MSNKKKKPTINRTEVKVMILRKYGTITVFTSKHGINYDSFRHFLAGREDLTRINRKVVKIMVRYGYNPYAEPPEPQLTPVEKQQLLALV